jgi:hypothetical protein
MNNCKECELAVYCYSEPSSWMFRTMEEMREKQQKMAACPLYPQSHAARIRTETSGCSPERHGLYP